MSDPAVDVAYNVRATVPEGVFLETIAAYRSESQRATEGLEGSTGLRYDTSSDERLDVWGTSSELRPAVIAIHGGYWRQLSRHDTAFMARTFADAGVATVVVDYTLAPTATLEEIVRQVRASVAWVYHHGRDHGLDPQRIFVTGSSAGGHLAAATMVGGSWRREHELPDDVVKGGMPISGLFDLRPLVDSFANEWLFLDPSRAAALSPMLHVAGLPRPRAIVAVAEHDGSGFLQQSADFQAAWSASGGEASLLVVPGRHHYDVFLDLADRNSALSRTFLAGMVCRGN